MRFADLCFVFSVLFGLSLPVLGQGKDSFGYSSAMGTFCSSIARAGEEKRA
jgi:hypothetical protein